MTKFYVVAIFAMLYSPAFGGSFTTYSLELNHSLVGDVEEFFDGNGILVPSLQTTTLSNGLSYGFALNASKTDSFLSQDGQGIKNLGVSGYISNNDMGLDLFLDVEDVYGAHTTSVKFQWQTTDSWRLNARDANAVLPNLGLRGNFIFTGEVRSQEQNIGVSGDPFSLELFGGIGIKSIDVPKSIITNGGNVTLNQAFGLGLSDPFQSSGKMSFIYKAIWEFNGPDIFRIITGHTLTLESITFEDGTTPEEHGFDIIFDSGRTSPNLAPAVPEPSTFALLGLGSIALAGYGWRRKRQQAA